MLGPSVFPEFFVRDIEASLQFYTDGLGFSIVRRDQHFAVIARESAILLLAMPQAAPGPEAQSAVRGWLSEGHRGVGVNILIMVSDVDAVYRRVQEIGAPVFWEIADRYYGLRDFIVTDPDGYELRFASPVGGSRPVD